MRSAPRLSPFEPLHSVQRDEQLVLPTSELVAAVHWPKSIRRRVSMDENTLPHRKSRPPAPSAARGSLHHLNVSDLDTSE